MQVLNQGLRQFERLCGRIRHSAWLKSQRWIWDVIRPAYTGVLGWFGRRGLLRTLNGTDAVYVATRFRSLTDSYEPEVWARVMQELKPGDTVVDVGAFIGLYTVAMAKRVGMGGQVIALEPDPENFKALEAHVQLNGVADRVRLVPGAASAQDGEALFGSGHSSESSLGRTDPTTAIRVKCVRLDTLFTGKVDIIKIDVEGFEEHVLRGAERLLKHPERRPRILFIEVHPYAWSQAGSTSASLIACLTELGYAPMDLTGNPMIQIDRYGEIMARPRA